MIKLVYSASRAKARTLDDEAMAWVVRLTSGESTREDHEDFRRWRDTGPDHLAALDRARALWSKLGTALPQVERRQERIGRRGAMLARLVPIAATLLLSLDLGYHYWAVGRFDHVTAVGERRTVALPDGSRVVMSGDTAFNASMGPGLRRIDLERGEILVEAHHNAADPLVVHAGKARFRDVGTVFDISRSGDGARLVVAEGIVEASRDDRRRLVTQGQTVTVDGTLGSVESADAAAETAWSGGRLIIKDRTLPQILATLAPYYRGHIVSLKSDDGQLLSATIDLDHIDGWLTALEQLKGLRAAHIGSYTVLS